MESVPLPSGRTLIVAIAPFAVASKLRKVVAGELLGVELELGKIDLNLDLKNLDPRTLNTMKNVVCRLLASEAVEAALFECAVRSTVEGVKVTRETFEAAEYRADFLPVAWEVIRANLAPFFAGLSLSSLTSSGQKSGAP